MLKREKKIKLILQGNTQKEGLLEIYSEAPNDEDMVMLNLIVDDKEFSSISGDYFFALQKLRYDLEEKNIQIVCNGAALNVYPSRMALSMSRGLRAYKITIGKQAEIEDLVDIFEYEDDLKFVSVAEQEKFFKDWIKSLGF